MSSRSDKALQIIDITLPQTYDIAAVISLTETFEPYAESLSFMEILNGFSIRLVSHHLSKIKSILKTKKIKHTISINEIDLEKNWLLESYQQFPPLNIDRFFIYGSHYEGEIPPKKIALKIDAATAFGSGEHHTTKGCLDSLLFLKDSKFKPKSILDMGTGSGILALAAYQLWKKPVLAIDNDKESVRVACHHRKINHIPAGETAVQCAYGDGFSARKVKQQAPFDLIIANILAAPLIEMAEIASSCLKKNGYMVLSGILKTQSSAVKSAYRKQGLDVIKTLNRGDWVAIILKR